eukprot:PhM_4_TR18494/c0_g1_i2/m.44939
MISPTNTVRSHPYTAASWASPVPTVVAMPGNDLWHPDRIAQDSKVPVVLIAYYLFDLILSLANYLHYYRHEEATYGLDFVKGYLAFVVLGLLFFGAVASVLWVWAARYSVSHKDRRRRLMWGVFVVYLSNVLPLWIMEYHAFLCCNVGNEFQRFCFAMKTITWLLTSTLVWLSWAWRAARWLEMNFPEWGATAIGGGGGGGGISRVPYVAAVPTAVYTTTPSYPQPTSPTYSSQRQHVLQRPLLEQQYSPDFERQQQQQHRAVVVGPHGGLNSYVARPSPSPENVYAATQQQQQQQRGPDSPAHSIASSRSLGGFGSARRGSRGYYDEGGEYDAARSPSHTSLYAERRRAGGPPAGWF